ncbi:little elongation complex subunit 2 [Xiphophorus maculatus]|uniref:Interactor of little elongation complex ELL subunit 2 n=1 Tax=Xiphophorus maculatus TaxID=8083 RepID=M3ZM10_XIPMA|nr:little elongation complex subunit 2 [Xiphophorus maculatus]XP_023208786.1 little elongation complex subunit 2 [Xiphophorus maculatus]
MELVWDDDAPPDGPFFTRDLYDKHSLAPHIRELWAFLQSPAENTDVNQEYEESAEDHSAPSRKNPAKLKGSQASGWESCDSDGTDSEEPKKSKRERTSCKKTETEIDVAYPEPRLPYPCLSSLSTKDQKTYVGYLMNMKSRTLPKNLILRINNEVIQFTKYLQDVAKICADDYNFITQGAMQYTEEFFTACLESVKALPQFYQIDEVTSLTGGTFNPGLALTFEKQLLTMGTVNITDHKMVPADAQLASDYHSVSSANPPAKKAKDKHARISSDGNTEKLCAYYEPHVCLTRDALVRLLDNHGPDFGDQWELPVLVKITPGEGSSKRKTVYIDSPLLKRDVTIRERSHIYYEESLKLSIMTNGSKKVFHLMTERPAPEQQQEASVRGCVSVENKGLNFEVDLTDLETFGETTTKTPQIKKTQSQQDEELQSSGSSSTPVVTKPKNSNKTLKVSSFSQGGLNSASKNKNNTRTETSQLIVSEPELQKTESSGSDQKCDKDEGFMAGSDDEKLIIDETGSSVALPTNQSERLTPTCSADSSVTSSVQSTPANTVSSPPCKRTRSKRTTRQTKAPEDQLGEILRMQTAMFKSGSEPSPAVKSPSRCLGPQLNPHTTSMVKPCVSSYLERHQNEDAESRVVLPESVITHISPTEHKKILSENLQACAEDEQDYEAPVEGNLLYKLYSLQDLLVMVRSSVSLTHTRKVDNQNQHVPVHVLPKLEYQLSYGVECLTNSEACQLWTETSLHSSTVPYIAHINAHTSKVALLRKLPDDWMQNISCGFKPSKSLNILHHLLKKLTGLDKGQYLIVHKTGEAFVTLLKAGGEKVSRGAYNLQQNHSSVSQPPKLGIVPWIPVDPAVVLPFHQQHGRVPCTFPPNTFQKAAKDGNYNPRGGQKKNPNVQKNKQTKRSARRKKYIKKLVEKSV